GTSPHSESGGYWIARSSRAMTAQGRIMRPPPGGRVCRYAASRITPSGLRRSRAVRLQHMPGERRLENLVLSFGDHHAALVAPYRLLERCPSEEALRDRNRLALAVPEVFRHLAMGRKPDVGELGKITQQLQELRRDHRTTAEMGVDAEMQDAGRF